MSAFEWRDEPASPLGSLVGLYSVIDGNCDMLASNLLAGSNGLYSVALPVLWS